MFLAHLSSIPIRDVSPIHSTPPVSLVDTDKTITDPLVVTDSTLPYDANEVELSDGESTLKEDSDTANVINLFRQPSVSDVLSFH